ncbi:tyrosine-type recombinase/integrase [Thioclava sp. GXIMD4215]|uniref:tyrosine-type recombinase/integrase n=1 Tax=Thioclava sp. GXIMD4215 TaxID=3131928 RepID=UPI003248D6EC
MTVIRIKGFKIFKDKKPPYKQRCYHRKTNTKIDLDRFPIGTAEFFSECDRIRLISEAAKRAAPKAGTLGGLIETYYRTEHFADTLSDRTRKDYLKVADYLEPIRDIPATSITTPLLTDIHDKASKKLGWRQANILRTFLSEVFKYNIPKGQIDQNYATGVIPKPRPKNRPRANRPWTIEELVFVLDNAPSQIAAAIALMANTGLDPSDALSLTRNAISDGMIWAQRGKTGNQAPMPMPERLKAVLDAQPPHDAITILATSRGRPWTYDGFSTVWHRYKATQVAAETLPADLTLKGLRHTMATILRESGMDLRSIADLLGQKTESMANWYSRDAELAERNRETMQAYQDEIERRTKTVKPFPKTVKPQ